MPDATWSLEAVYPFCPKCLRYLSRPESVTPETATQGVHVTCGLCGWWGLVRYYRVIR